MSELTPVKRKAIRKLEVIVLYHSTKKISAVSRETKIPRKQISEWIRNQDKLMAYDGSPRIKRILNEIAGHFPEVKIEVKKWLHTERESLEEMV